MAGCTSKHAAVDTPVVAAAATPSASGSESTGPASLTGTASSSTARSTSVGTIKPLPSFTFNLSARPSAPTDQDVALGQAILDREKTGTLSWRVNGIRFATRSADGVETPDNGRYAILDVTVAASGGSVDVDPASLTLQTSDDQEWTSYFTGPLFPPELKSRRLGPGQSMRGNLTFDITNARVVRIALYTSASAAMGWHVS